VVRAERKKGDKKNFGSAQKRSEEKNRIDDDDDDNQVLILDIERTTAMMELLPLFISDGRLTIGQSAAGLVRGVFLSLLDAATKRREKTHCAI
jgi:hypothetical protein